MPSHSSAHATSARGRSPSSRLATGFAGLTLFLGVAALGTTAFRGTAGASTALHVVTARPVLPSGARADGSLSAGRELSGVVALKARNTTELAEYASAVAMTGSALYGHYLSRGEFARDFAPSKSAERAVTRQLRSDGLTVGKTTEDGGLLVPFSGTARRVASAFHTSLERYRLRNGRLGYAATSAAEMPQLSASHVQEVVGLDDLVVPQVVGAPRGVAGHTKPVVPSTSTAAKNGPDACAAAVDTAQESGGLTDNDIAYAYGANGLYAKGETGKGETIAVYELEPFELSDVKTFDTCYFGATKADAIAGRVKVVSVDGGQQVGPGSGEAILDLDDVTALAPGASYDVYEAPDTNEGYLDNYAQFVENDSAQIMTSSWGDCEVLDESYIPGFLQTSHILFEQAAAQGQTILNAVGDTGSDCMEEFGIVSPALSVTDTGDDPFVLGVGGTTITDATDPPSEQVWNDGALGGAGSGGISAVWGAPAWQIPFVNSSIVAKAETVSGTDFCGQADCREIPDVSAQADEFTGAVTSYSASYGGWYTIGGTSSSSPLWAAMLADIGSTAACQGAGHELGFVTPKLYAIAGNSAEYKASFTDITKGNNDAFGLSDGLYPATAGYDMASGLGSPRLTGAGGANDGLADYLCDTPGVTPTVTSVESTTNPGTNAVPASDPGTATVTGTGFESGTTDDVRAVTVGNLTTSFDVTSATTMTVTLPSGADEAGNGAPSGSDGAGTQDLTVTLSDGETSAPLSGSTVVYYSTTTSSSGNPEIGTVFGQGTSSSGGQEIRIYGAGFGSAGGSATVTVGGVDATDVDVVNEDLVTAVTPAESSSACLNQAEDIGPGQSTFNPDVDTCQVQVQVTVGGTSSPESTIEPEFQGAVANEGESGTGELYPAATELDYEPAPTVTSVSVTTGDASEDGGTQATITGTGFGALGELWFNVGPYQQGLSSYYSVLSVSATQLVVDLPPIAPTAAAISEPVTVQTTGSPDTTDFAGSQAPSNAVDVTYAPTPNLAGLEVLTSKGAKAAYTAGPDTGGTELKLTGSGLEDAVPQADEGLAYVEFIETGSGLPGEVSASTTTTYSLASVNSAGTELTLDTPGDNPGVDQVSYCNVSGCSGPFPGDKFTYYPLGNPSVSSIAPAKGKLGTKVTIDGANLGFVEAVYFGTKKATDAKNPPDYLDSGQTGSITAVAPKGAAGKQVDIRVVTLESKATGYGKSAVNKKVTFTYDKGTAKKKR